jgi:hypothetical protein
MKTKMTVTAAAATTTTTLISFIPLKDETTILKKDAINHNLFATDDNFL